jgi:hypothetical protein
MLGIKMIVEGTWLVYVRQILAGKVSETDESSDCIKTQNMISNMS